MSLEQASLWLTGSILFILGSIVITVGLVIINNILYKYWKPVTIFSKDSFTLFTSASAAVDPMQALTQDEYDKLVEYLEDLRNKEKTEPSLENKGKK